MRGSVRLDMSQQKDNTEQQPLLSISGLKTYFFLDEGIVRAVDGVDLKIPRGKTVGVVGESGCGKSVMAMSVLRLISPPGRIVSGRIILHHDGTLLFTGHITGRRSFRSSIFQLTQTHTCSWTHSAIRFSTIDTMRQQRSTSRATTAMPPKRLRWAAMRQTKNRSCFRPLSC